jgi:hypothetical protein
MKNKSIIFASLVLIGCITHNMEGIWHIPGSTTIVSSAKTCLTFCQKLPKIALASAALVGLGYLICNVVNKKNTHTQVPAPEIIRLHNVYVAFSDQELQRLRGFIFLENANLRSELARLQALLPAPQTTTHQSNPAAEEDLSTIAHLQQSLRTAQAQAVTVREQLSATVANQQPILQELGRYKTLATENARQIQLLSMANKELRAKLPSN